MRKRQWHDTLHAYGAGITAADEEPRVAPHGPSVRRTVPAAWRQRSRTLDGLHGGSLWVTRYLASKNLGGHYTQSPDRVWDVLMRLTHDPERFVREGVPLSLAVIAANDSTPEIEDKVLALARSEDAHVRRTSAYTALVLWRQGQCGELRTAMLKQVARKRDDGIGRLVGRRIVAEEIAKIDEQGAMALVEEWRKAPTRCCTGRRSRHCRDRSRPRFPSV